MWLPNTGIWYSAVWQKCDCQSQGFVTVHCDRNVTAKHRDLLPCSMTEMWLPITGIFLPCSMTEIWLPMTGICYGALWPKCDSQSQGFCTVNSDRNVTTNHRDSVPCSLTEMWLPITVMSWREISQKYGSLSREYFPSFLAFKNTLVWSWSQQVSPNVSFSQTIHMATSESSVFFTVTAERN
jgi:hypothetical protein